MIKANKQSYQGNDGDHGVLAPDRFKLGCGQWPSSCAVPESDVVGRTGLSLGVWLNGREHQPSKLRVAGSSPAAVASQKRSAPEGAGHEQVAGPEGGWRAGSRSMHQTGKGSVPSARRPWWRPSSPPPPICSAQSMEQLDG